MKQEKLPIMSNTKREPAFMLVVKERIDVLLRSKIYSDLTEAKWAAFLYGHFKVSWPSKKNYIVLTFDNATSTNITELAQYRRD